MSFKFLCSPCTKQKWKGDNYYQLTFDQHPTAPVITPQAWGPADKTNTHPIGVIVFPSSQERFKQGRQICTTDNRSVLQQQCTAKGRTILVKLESSQVCTGFAYIPAILLLSDFVLANNSAALRVPVPKLSVISCLLLVIGWKKEKWLLHACSFAGSSYSINLISDRMNWNYRETRLAQSTGQGGQGKSHQLLVISTQNWSTWKKQM